MQSHPEAALLSHPGDSKVTSNVEDDEKDFQEDDADDDFIDEVFSFLLMSAFPLHIRSLRFIVAPLCA